MCFIDTAAGGIATSLLLFWPSCFPFSHLVFKIGYSKRLCKYLNFSTFVGVLASYRISTNIKDYKYPGYDCSLLLTNVSTGLHGIM